MIIHKERSTDHEAVTETLEHELIGYIGFSPAEIHTENTTSIGLALEPLAVAQKHQGTGVGTALVHAALEYAHNLMADWVVFLGDPQYYSRFEFIAATDFELTHDYETGPVQILPLVSSDIPIPAGHIYYSKVFQGLS